jgi:uncharacterized membrane protein HdeD (DUF308 family)
MNPQQQEMLKQLATKLGTTTEYLWGVLVHGNHVEGFILLVYTLFGVALVIAGYRLVEWSLREDARYNDDWAMFVGVISAAAGTICVVAFSYWCIMDLFCPEYGALTDILSHISK